VTTSMSITGKPSVRVRASEQLIALQILSDDWRESCTVRRTRQQLVDLISEITVQVMACPPVGSDPDTDLVDEAEARFEYGDLPVQSQPLDLRTPGQIRDEEDEAAAAHQQMIEGQR
jgi:hypothetical protein